MPRPKAPPSYCSHKRSGRAYTTVDGRQIQLGVAGSVESRSAFDRLLGQWYANGRTLPAAATTATSVVPTGPTVSIVIDAFWRHAETYYAAPQDHGPNASGKQPNEQLDAFRQSLRILRQLYGGMSAACFTCTHLEAVRQAMINPRKNPTTGKTEAAWCRTHTNRQIGRIKHVFGWAVTKDLVPASVHETLNRLQGLRVGKTSARESRRVRSVNESRALEIVPFVSPQVGAMIKLQLVTGMRSTELCIMRPKDIDQTRSPWTYTPAFHKTQHHGIAREIPLGPQARVIITPFLFRDPQAFLFTPAEAMADRYRKQREKLAAEGKALTDPEHRRQTKRERDVQPRYDRRTYYRAVLYGCELTFGMPKEFRSSESDRPRKTDTPAQVKAKAKVRADKAAKRRAWHAANAWHPHQARHSAATDITRKSGKEIAQTVLGHTTMRMTDTYVDPDVERAREVMERIG